MQAGRLLAAILLVDKNIHHTKTGRDGSADSDPRLSKITQLYVQPS